MNIPLVFVCSETDFPKLEINLLLYKEYLSKTIIVIGKASLKQKCLEKELVFIDEDKLFPHLTYKTVADILSQRNINNSRTGWYFQQFLKMAYAFVCPEPYYLLWDADTIPLHKYEFSETPVFNTKTEYHKPYFDTLQKLFPELGKEHDYSYIAEHMLINTQIMKEIVNKIGNTDTERFFEKILRAIDDEELAKSGFSEYETYGTYVEHHYPGMYTTKNWVSMRAGDGWCEISLLTPHLIDWLSRKFDAASFDNWQVIDKHLQKFMILFSQFYDYDDAKSLYILYLQNRLLFLKHIGLRKFIRIVTFPWFNRNK